MHPRLRDHLPTTASIVVLMCALLLLPLPVQAADSLSLLETPPPRAAPVIKTVPKPRPPAPVVVEAPSVTMSPALTTPVPVIPILQQSVPVVTPSPAPLGAKLTPARSVPKAAATCPRFACDGVYWLAGFMASVLTCGGLIWRWRRHTFRDAATLAALAGLPVVKTLPRLPDHAILAVTGTSTGEGVSATALRLARAAAKARQRVILIDCNLHTPSVHHHVPDPAAPSLIDMLTGQARLAEVVQRDAQTGLHLIPARAVPNTAAGLLQSAPFEKLLQALRDVYDLVILDTPAMAVAVEARGLCARADHIVYCVARGRTPRQAVLAGLQAIPAAAKSRVMLVLTEED